MAANFDPYDKSSWYFGPLSRQEATDLLTQKESGIFLIRNSISSQGDLVLCVKEDNKISHYIINRILQGDQVRFRIGDQVFPDIPSLLNFYKLHYLDTTPLIKPLERKIEKVRAKYDFEGSGDPDDLPFKKGEILSIITKDEEQWWTGRNHLGQTGSIPVPYVEKIDDCEENECFIAEQPLEDQLTQVPPPPPEQTSEKLEPFKQTMPNFQVNFSLFNVLLLFWS
ncbi:adapter molecule Crk-like [Centruroides sculpturatus]|uniref:adapter molecule Crk-like n=1 Tax=Centruroides sculpturatus TaxID=218467 RepID=UPI000C6C930F|nr:adapter molecule Crk-like [Centruroides sculpturatus]